MSVHGLWTGQTASVGDVINNDRWYLDGYYTSPPYLYIDNSTIGSINTDNWWSGRAEANGNVTINHGIHVGAFSGFSLSEQGVIPSPFNEPRTTVTLNGNTSAVYHSTFTIYSGVATNFINNGTIELHASNAKLLTPILGTGDIVQDGHPLPSDGENYCQTELGSSVSAGETIWCLEGHLAIDAPELMHGTIEGLGDGIYLSNVHFMSDEKLTATDFTFTSTAYNPDGSVASSTPIDLHIRDTPFHQIAIRAYGYGDGSAWLTAQTSSVGAIPQVVIHQT